MVDTEEFNPPNLTKIPQGKFLNDINDLFDVDSIEEFKKKIEALMAKTSAQFERLKNSSRPHPKH